jgi:hypothetical protein
MASNQSLDDLMRAYYESQIGSGTPATQATAPAPSASAPGLTGNGNFTALLAAPQQLGAAGSRRIFSYNLFNPAAAVTFLNLYNKATAPVLGTDAPIDWLAVPPGAVLDGYWEASPVFNLGAWVAATTIPAGAVAPGTGLIVSLGFM